MKENIELYYFFFQSQPLVQRGCCTPLSTSLLPQSLLLAVVIGWSFQRESRWRRPGYELCRTSRDFMILHMKNLYIPLIFTVHFSRNLKATRPTTLTLTDVRPRNWFMCVSHSALLTFSRRLLFIHICVTMTVSLLQENSTELHSWNCRLLFLKLVLHGWKVRMT